MNYFFQMNFTLLSIAVRIIPGLSEIPRFYIYVKNIISSIQIIKYTNVLNFSK